ncbi:MAG: hypothetical protein WCC53_10685 [Thermoanaerobaculia bacterium]
MRRISFLTAAGFLLLGVFCVAPQPARADAVEDLAKVLDVVGSLPGVPINGQDVRESRSLFACIDKAGDDVAVANCLDAFKDTSVGKKAWSQTGLPSWFLKLIDVYIDVREGDFWGLVKDAGYTIACAVANVVFAVDVCGIAQAILETIQGAKELLSDVVGFIKDVGGAILDFFGLGGGSSGPPLWQVVFNGDLKPHLGEYAEDWFEQPSKFKTEFDVTGKQSQSLLCTIAQKRFAKSCAWMFGPAIGMMDQTLQPWLRGDTIKAIKMAQAAAVAQAIATMGKTAKEWLAFRHDWLAERAPADRLRKAYGIWGPPAIRLNCVAAAAPWKQFLDNVQQPDVKPEANKALSGLAGWTGQTTTQFCQVYEAGLNAQKLTGCAVVGTPNAQTLKLDCNPGASHTTCGSDAKAAGSTKFPPAFDLQCATHALRMSDQKTGSAEMKPKPPNLAPTPVKPAGIPEGPSPR